MKKKYGIEIPERYNVIELLGIPDKWNIQYSPDKTQEVPWRDDTELKIMSREDMLSSGHSSEGRVSDLQWLEIPDMEKDIIKTPKVKAEEMLYGNSGPSREQFMPQSAAAPAQYANIQTSSIRQPMMSTFSLRDTLHHQNEACRQNLVYIDRPAKTPEMTLDNILQTRPELKLTDEQKKQRKEEIKQLQQIWQDARQPEEDFHKMLRDREAYPGRKLPLRTGLEDTDMQQPQTGADLPSLQDELQKEWKKTQQTDSSETKLWQEAERLDPGFSRNPEMGRGGSPIKPIQMPEYGKSQREETGAFQPDEKMLESIKKLMEKPAHSEAAQPESKNIVDMLTDLSAEQRQELSAKLRELLPEEPKIAPAPAKTAEDKIAMINRLRGKGQPSIAKHYFMSAARDRDMGR